MARAASRYAWSNRVQAPTSVPLVAPIDPEHLKPTANPGEGYGNPEWVATVHAPGLPGEYLTMNHEVDPYGFGPVDHTPPDPQHGVGVGPGLTVQQSQRLMGALHGEDLGAVAAHAWEPSIDRDGSRHLNPSYDDWGDGDSPQTLQYERTGVGEPNDPHARKGRPRLKRWANFVWDWHWFDPEMRPLALRYARPAVDAPPVANGTQLDGPYGTLEYLSTRDQFTGPQTRRTPGPWDQPLQVDGSETVTAFGLGSWGL
jgi:hypothetical protein